MYFPYFATYMIIGFGISLIVFFWALNRGQFQDQQRARFLPLEDDVAQPAARLSRISRIETSALWILACAGLAASGAVLVFALFSAG
jgi:cbb3-type cytochrome oxidase maturation protein